MGYLHINNLYKDQRVLDFKRVYILEKIHGTSAHLKFHPGADGQPSRVTYFSGGENHANFLALFIGREAELIAEYERMFAGREVTVYGEAYGGKQQGMSHTYGKQLCFIAFDVQVGETWLNVENACKVVTNMGIEFVPWKVVETDLTVLDAERDAPSEVAVRRGITEPKPREGIIIRPMFECLASNGDRIIAKHKGDAFKETATPRKVVDPNKQEVIRDAEAAAMEWVTEMRLDHVLDKIPAELHRIENTGTVIKAMVEDVLRESAGEISVEPKVLAAAIGKRTAQMFKNRVAVLKR